MRTRPKTLFFRASSVITPPSGAGGSITIDGSALTLDGASLTLA